jgi:hypothetical protein
MPAAAEREAATPGAPAGCGRPDCCSRPGATPAPGRVLLAYGLPTLSVLTAAAIAAALGLPAPAAALAVPAALVLAAGLAGRLDGDHRRGPAAHPTPLANATIAKELPCP